MNNEGSIKLLLIGAGAILAFTQFGPIGVVVLGLVLMMVNK